jgi:hypothetical protein
MFRHRGGKLDVWDADGNKVGTIHYGPGLNKPCNDCKSSAGTRCVTTSGKLLGKSHQGRLT